ncbi:hypothetical protein IU501_01830 [Nocardia otitidiscaviarum]|uniref:EcsC protein family n=1 Tax=Nocardia otitidiscaviarum TaxID=1823 RepID=A0A378Y8W4_9NOCA|nr:hypothetical protein [Nocardia otitidiscaviarum]MBF6131745.1 hypothetical protein [Nocardia otitidiscaviarum]SUA73163.1 Uncharacterised protein [Nocardia otitidiscaviarum]
MFERTVQKSIELLLRGGTGVQAPLAARYVDRLRRKHPSRSPEDIAQGLETRYLVLVTASGTVAGLSAAVPGVGTLIGLAVSGVESVFFLEASALYAASVGAVHGIGALPPEQRRAMVVSVVLGETGTAVMGKNASQSARDWAAVVADRLPVVRNIDNALVKRFVVQFIVKRGVLVFGRALPAGIGAVIGAVGNRALGKSVIANAHSTFGPPPRTWDDAASGTVAAGTSALG